MRKVFLITLAALALLAPTAATAAATAKDPRVPALQRRVAALEGRVATLESAVTALLRYSDLTECRFVYQFHYNVEVLNIFSLMFGQPQYSGGYPSDNGACARVGMAPPARTLSMSGFRRTARALSTLAALR